MVLTNFPIVTDRTRLRRLVPSDLADFQYYRHDEDAGRYQGWLPQTDAEATLFLEQMGSAELFRPGEWFQLGIADRETDTLIGDIGICVSATEPEAEIGFTVGRNKATQETGHATFTDKRSVISRFPM